MIKKEDLEYQNNLRKKNGHGRQKRFSDQAFSDDTDVDLGKIEATKRWELKQKFKGKKTFRNTGRSPRREDAKDNGITRKNL